MYRFIDNSGREQTIATARELVDAIRGGRITSQTLIQRSSEQRWVRADQLDAFQAAEAALRSSSSPDAGRAREGGAESLGSNRPQRGKSEAGAGAHTSYYSVGAQFPESQGPIVGARHRWQGILYYWLCYLGAGFWGIGAVVLPMILMAEGEGGAVAFIVFGLLAGVAVTSYMIGRGVERFRAWARVVALGLAYLAAFGGLVSCIAGPDDPESFAGLLGGILNLVFIFYFHSMAEAFRGQPGRV